ncbi:MAG: hypothetical protein A2X31_00495 [Elusimicrobia bacterium GWB2_63_22]|nr:MAG: hypothetical protein A2X31_00495 [Elusimicrobia bacterium GWB2_63_22]
MDDESPIIPELPPNPDPIIIPEPGDPSEEPTDPDPVAVPADGIRTFPAAEIRSILATTEVGPITVAGSDGDVTVEVFGGDPEKCRVTMELREDKLLLRTESSRKVKERVPFGRGKKWADCPAGLKVRAPSGVDFNAKSGAGKIGVSGIAGAVSVKSGSGAVALSALAGEVEVEVGMADIFGELCAKQLTIRGRGAKVDLTGLCGPADIDTGGGSVALEWATVPASGMASVKTKVADIFLVFPLDASIGANLKSYTGSITNEFAEGGAFSVLARSRAGNISVLKAK